MRHKHGYVLGDFGPGGGFGIRFEESDDPPAADAFVQTIAEAGNSRNRKPLPRLLIEPGQSIIARAGVALYSVGTIKTIPDSHTR
jgi:diaminopimelate decarboxylase